MASIKGISANLGFKVLAYLAAFFFQIYYARVLGPEVLGNFGLAMSVFALINVLAVMGLDTSLTRSLPQFRTQADFTEKVALYLGYALRFSTMLCLGFLLTAVMLRHDISRIISPGSDIGIYIVLFAPISLLTVWGLLFGAAMRAWERFTAYSFANDFLPRFALGSTFAGAYEITGRGQFSYLLGSALAPVLQLSAMLRFLGVDTLRRLVRPPKDLGSQARATFLRFGLKTALYSFLVSGMAQTARLALGYFGENEGVGVYMVVESLAAVLVFVQSSFGTVFTPQIARLYHTGQRDAMLVLFRRLSRWAVVATVPFFMVVLVDSREIIGLYGDEFAGGQSALVVLMSAQFAVVSLGLNGNVLYMTGRENVMVAGQVANLVAAVAASFVLIPRLGLVGAALAIGGSAVVVNMGFMVAVGRLYNVTQFSVDSWRTLMAGVSLALVLRLLVVPLQFGNIMFNVIGKLMLSYLVFAVLVLLVDRRQEDVEVLTALWSRLRRSFR